MSSTSMPLLPPGAATSSLGRWRGRSKGLTRRRREKQIPVNLLNHSFLRKIENVADPVANSKTVLPQKIQSTISDRCFQVLSDILVKLGKKDTNQIFACPVDGSIVTDYHDIVKNPMDFRTMREKISRRDYKNFESFEVDVQLIINNCYLYNAPSTVFYKAAQSIEECWGKWRDRFYIRFLSALENVTEASGRNEAAVNVQREALPTSSGWRMRRIRGGVSRGVMRSTVRHSRHPAGSEDIGGAIQGSPGEALLPLKVNTTNQIYSSIPSEICQERGVNKVPKDSSYVPTQRSPSLSKLLLHPEGKNYLKHALNIVSSPETFLYNLSMGQEWQCNALKPAETIRNASSTLVGTSNSEILSNSVYVTPTKDVELLKEYCHTLMSTAPETSFNEISSSCKVSSLACTSRESFVDPFGLASTLSKSPSNLNYTSIFSSASNSMEESFDAYEAMRYFQSIQAFIGEYNFDKLERLYPERIAALHMYCSSNPLPPLPFNDLRFFGIDTGEFSSANAYSPPHGSGSDASFATIAEHSLLGVGEVSVRSALALQKGPNKINMKALEILADKYRSCLSNIGSFEMNSNHESSRNRGESSFVTNLFPFRLPLEAASQDVYTQRSPPFRTPGDFSGGKYIDQIHKQDDVGAMPQYASQSLHGSLPPYSIPDLSPSNTDFYSNQNARQWQDAQKSTSYLDLTSSAERNSNFCNGVTH